MNLKVRQATQAGAFYAGTAKSLKAQIESCFLGKYGPGRLPKLNEKGERIIKALVCPHAGYMYSGQVAAHSYYALAKDGIPNSIVIIGPNHTGMGSGVSIMDEGKWATPLGELEIDSILAKEICKHSSIIDIDEMAHKYEHSIEVQIPFLQYIYGSKIKFVPICMMLQDLETSIEVGEAIAKALSNKNSVVIASSDMTHYEPQEIAKKKDELALNAIIELNEKKLHEVIEKESISMCGYGPVTVAINASKSLGANEAKLLCYKTSGDITGDYGAVVGYASVLIA
ncbi:MAG: AmmeMemoRadiSam system protein B [Candidatus Bathyarchaeia archaeon]